MYSIWTKGVKDQDDKALLEKNLKNSRWVLDKLSEILYDQEKQLDRSETNPKTYEIPNWDYRQAHNNGYRQCLSLIQKLINLDQKEANDPN